MPHCPKTALRRRRCMNDRGFSLVELLVVVVVLGILIAIAIPVYLNHQRSARDASAESDLRTLRTEQRDYMANNSTFATTRQLVAANPSLKLSEKTWGAVIWSSDTAFCVATLNSEGSRDPNSPLMFAGRDDKVYFFDSRTASVSTSVCQAPSGATGFDNSYVADDGLHTF